MATKNNELVPQETLDNLKSLDAQLVSSAEAMEKLLVKTQQISTDLSKSAKSYKELVDVISTYEKVNNETDKTLKKAKETLSEIDKEKQKLIKSTSAEAKAIAELRVQTEQNNRANKNTAKENLAAEGSVDQLRAALIRLRIEYDAMGTKAQQSPYGKFLAEDINKLNQEVLKAEVSTGRFGRNVGNYASGFNSLGFSVQQVARELPSLSVSISQFFLAISNNIPMLTDEFRRAGAAYKTAMQEGGDAAKNAISPTKAVIASVFSWQTALVVGLTLFAAYGKEIGNVFKQVIAGNGAIKTTKELQEDINKEFNNGSTKIGDQIVKVKDLSEKWVALGSDMKKQKQFIIDNKTEFDNLGVSITNSREAENLLVDNTDRFIESLKRRALATAAFRLAGSEYDKVISKELELQKAMEEGISFADRTAAQYSTQSQNMTQQEFFDIRINGMKNDVKQARQNADAIFDLGRAYEKQAEDELKAAGISEKTKQKTDKSAENAAKKAIEALKRRKEEEMKALDEINETNFKTEAETQKRILENEKNSYKDRMTAVNEFENLMGESINSRADKQITGLQAEYRRLSDIAKKGGQSIGTFEEEFGNELKVINQKREQELNNISTEGAKKREDILKDSLAIQKKALEESYSNTDIGISSREQEELQKLSQLYSKGGMSNEEYEKRKLAITRQYANERFNAELDMLEDIMTLYAGDESKQIDIQKKINAIRLKYNDKLNGELIKQDETAAKKREEIEKQRNELYMDAAQEAFDFITTLWDAETERNLAKLEQQSEDNQDWRDNEIERIERLEDSGAISKEQADARKKVVDDQAKERENQIEEQKKQIAINQAKREKAIALANVAINTAVAILKNTAQLGYLPAIPVNIATGILGALQAATILAQPLPQYAKGTDNHIGGLGIVGDGGRPEMVITPSGGIFKTPSIPTLVDMPKGTMVMPDYAKALANMNAERLPKDRSDSVTIFESVKQIKKIDESNRILKQMNQNINLGNQAIQREIIAGNSSVLRRGLISKHK